MAALFQLASPIGFDAPDEQPVNLLIFLLVPEAATQKHLEILSEIAELLSDAPLREKIKASADAAAAAPADRHLAIRAAADLAVKPTVVSADVLFEDHRARSSGNGWPGWAPPSAASTRSRCARPARAPTWSATSTTSIPTACRSWASARSPT